MKKKLTWILAGGLALFAVLQLFNPPRSNPPVKTDFIAAASPPMSVAASLRAACYDCHSHETTWPLYARLAPVSWLIASDVEEGRKHLNFSEWPTETAPAAKNLDRINEVVDYREMPSPLSWHLVVQRMLFSTCLRLRTRQKLSSPSKISNALVSAHHFLVISSHLANMS